MTNTGATKSTPLYNNPSETKPMTTTFEESFLAALDAAKPAHPRIKRSDDHKYVSFSTEYGEYQFGHRDTRKGGWQGGGTIYINGPTFGRTGKLRSPMSVLGTFNLGTGKLTYQVSDKITKDRTRHALDYFLAEYGGNEPDFFGWSINEREGWGIITKSPNDKRKFHKEVAIYAAQAPGSKLELYTPKGDRKLTYEERQKISPRILVYIDEKLRREGVYNDLVQSYMRVGRPVNAWEDGPGEKYFRAHGMSKSGLGESIGDKAKRLATERYEAGFKAGAATARRSGSTTHVPPQAERNNDFRRGYQDGVRGIKSR